MKLTAVEWLESKFNEFETIYYSLPSGLYEYVNQAKEMEKQKLEQFYNHGQWAIIEHGHGDTFEDYYNQTFNK